MVKFVSEAPKGGPGAVLAFPQLSAMAELALDRVHPRLENVIHIQPIAYPRGTASVLSLPHAAGVESAGLRTRSARARAGRTASRSACGTCARAGAASCARRRSGQRPRRCVRRAGAGSACRRCRATSTPRPGVRRRQRRARSPASAAELDASLRRRLPGWVKRASTLSKPSWLNLPSAMTVSAARSMNSAPGRARPRRSSWLR